jgi:hypothetical protein
LLPASSVLEATFLYLTQPQEDTAHQSVGFCYLLPNRRGFLFFAVDRDATLYLGSIANDVSAPSPPSPSSPYGDCVGGGAWISVVGNHPSTGPLAQSNPAGFFFLPARPE